MAARGETPSRDLLHGQTAQVPGDVLHDLWPPRPIRNPYLDRNSVPISWAAQRTWIYKKRFTTPGSPLTVRLTPPSEGAADAAENFPKGRRRDMPVAWSPEAQDRRFRVEFINSEVTFCE